MFQHDLHGQYLIQGKKSSTWKTSFVSKRSCSHLPPLAQSCMKQMLQTEITKQMSFRLPYHWNQQKHWAKWKPGARCDHLHIFQDIPPCIVTNKQTLKVPSVIMNELLSFVSRTYCPLFSLRCKWWKISIPSCGIEKHGNSYAQWNKTDPIDNKARVFGGVVKTKNQS